MEITNISSLDRTSFVNQDYKPQDETLLNSLEINNEFGNPDDKIEIHIISPNGDVIESAYNFRNYKIVTTSNNSSLFNKIELDPKSDLESFGYFSGQYDVNYNFYRQLFLSSPNNTFFISEISSDRTEIKITNNNISYNDLGKFYLDYITTRNSRSFYSDFIINLGKNKTYIAVNVALDNINTNIPSLFIKLYEPLPSDINIKTTLWIVESISEPYSFRVNTDFIVETINTTIPLRGPNVNIELNEKTNLTTPYLNLSNILINSSTSSYQQLKSWLEEKSIEITVDYTNFNNFIHFSSAINRLNNFKYKLTQIQLLQRDIDTLNNLNPLTSSAYINSNKEILQNKLNSIIEKFDGYEYYLYYESGSKSWPKITSTKPYINASVTSSLALNWFGNLNETSTYYGGEILSASIYDNLNKNYIWNNLPEYIKADPQNSNLELFTSMLGQHYDYIWTYIKDITDIQVADNRLDFGVSKDLVADTLRNFGIKLYTNSRNQDDIYSSLLGVNAEGSFLPSTGSYLINTYVTASQYTIPDNDIVKETYKRVYHNLPYLLKTRGTRTGLNALINCFGIPETILKIKEYGGSKKGDDLIEQITPKFNYNIENPNIVFPWNYSQKQFLDTGEYIMPDTLEFRFKLDSIIPTQSILLSDNGWRDIRVTYTTGSNANIDFGLSDDNNFIYSNPIELPLYNGDWWTLNLTRETGSLNILQTGSNNTYTLTIGNKNDLGIQYLTSSSIFITGSTQSLYNQFGWNGSETLISAFSGSIQEFRYWIGSIPLSDFKDHILNPRSISFNGVTGSYNNLIYRLPLGSELDTNLGSNIPSVHPSSTSSFTTNISSNISSSIVNGNYIDNFETYLVNTPNIGNITEIDEKVRIVSQSLITGSTLTPYISIQKPLNPSYTNDLSIVDISLSPQDSINSDIIAQLGSFNIDEYIGDPRLASSNSYPALIELRDFYFKKYSNSQNIFDLIKLLSYFDNSLFKMIKDFVPAKTNLSTGLVIKPHILERNKISRHEPILEFIQHSGSIKTAFITGSNSLNLGINTNNTSSTTYISGTINKVINDKRELFNGELGGTEIKIHEQINSNIVYELNNLPLSSSQDIIDNLSKLPINPILNNVALNRTVLDKLDIDYSYNPNIPVNQTYINNVLLGGQNINNYPFLQASLQDSNYTLYRHITPRYNGSKLIGNIYNTFTPGDISFGNEAVINYNSNQFVYFTEITSQSLTLPGRSNAKIKYLIDSSSNILELTEANKNLFDIQTIFSKTEANVSLENNVQPSNQIVLNGVKPIYASGFRYEPILQNYFSVNGNLSFTLQNPILTPATSASLTGSQISLGTNSISTPSFNIETPVSYNTLNVFTQSVQSTIDSYITVTVTKNTSFSGKIYQKVTGSIDVDTYISPFYSGDKPVFYSGYNLTGTSYTPPTIPGEYFANGYDGNSGFYPNDGILSIWVPNGVAVNIADFNNGVRSRLLTGPLTASGGQILQPGGGGIDWAGIYVYNTSASLNMSNIVNEFTNDITKIFRKGNGVDPINNITTYDDTIITTTSVSSQPLIYKNGLGIKFRYNIEGYIILDETVQNGQTVSVRLKNSSFQDAKIKGTAIFNNTILNGKIRLETVPSISINLVKNPTNSFYYGTPPTFYYNNNLIDNGFSSGSGAGNWYFERGSNPDYIYNQLTSSYDLSLNYFNYIQNSQNPFTQTSASFDGYDDITFPFLPKIGDIIRFWDVNRNEFPIDFERQIIKIIPPSSLPQSGSYNNRLVFILDSEIPNSAGNQNSNYIQNFIFLTKIEDETNIILKITKNNGQTSPGIILPTNINLKLKDEAGNIIKKLKSQNLI